MKIVCFIVLVFLLSAFGYFPLTAQEITVSSSAANISPNGGDVPSTWAKLYLRFENRSRFSNGPHNQECFTGSAPWGNWGVSSNYGAVIDGSQFEGWKNIDGKKQWNSCTVDPYDPPNCTYYNADSCTHQQTTTGNNT